MSFSLEGFFVQQKAPSKGTIVDYRRSRNKIFSYLTFHPTTGRRLSTVSSRFEIEEEEENGGIMPTQFVKWIHRSGR